MASAAQLLIVAMAILIPSTARCFASDTLSSSSAISGGQTVVSKGGCFELGFFLPAGGTGTNTSSRRNYYVGIWYKKAVSQCTPVWVANRAAPVADPASSRLAIAADGNLVLVDGSGKLVWSTNASTGGGSSGAVAVILDTGNLVLRRGGGDGAVLWQSMDHPTDTWLPGGRLGRNRATGEVRTLAAWRSAADPAPGAFSLAIDPGGASRYFLYWNGAGRYWSSGEWDGRIFAGISEMTSHYIYDFEFVAGAGNETYFTYSQQDPTVISRFVLDFSGQVKQLIWVPSAGEWMVIWAEPSQLRDVYAVCGAFGVSDEKSQPFCSCPDGFRPASVGDWELGDHAGGCRRNTPLRRCDIGPNVPVHGEDDDDAFLLMPDISLPRNPSFAQASSAQDCRLACLRNCDCNAYSYDGGGCDLWHSDLLNLQRLADDTPGGDGLYLRFSAMDAPPKGIKKTIALASIGSIASILVLSVIVSLLVLMFKRRRSRMRLMEASEGANLVAFQYGDVRRATRNFSEKLDGGSFGSVYKGTLPGGRAAIAVKKLEALLCVGEKQFRNEVRTIGVIQHVNLVRLRGFSSRGGERLLVYDYMPNGSLDRALFGAAPVLSWRARFQIALGAARGLLYLHEGCRDCIIHCDVKPENILLDEGLVPKVADFGMAKLLGREFSRVLTTVRGTIGYLAPEWIAGVPITAKADVYSYGMVLLEIVSGRRNARCWPATEQGSSLAGYFPLVAAKKVNQGEALVGLLDERLHGDAVARELERACRVACWCIQDDVACRPTMEKVVQALEGIVTVDVPPIPSSLRALAGDAGAVSRGHKLIRSATSPLCKPLNLAPS